MKKRKYTKSDSVHIKDVLNNLIRNCRKESNTELAAIRQAWNNTFNKAITDNAQPAALKDGVLLITVKSSTVTYQLRFQTNDIIKHINQAMGQQRICDIKLKIGNF